MIAEIILVILVSFVGLMITTTMWIGFRGLKYKKALNIAIKASKAYLNSPAYIYDSSVEYRLPKNVEELQSNIKVLTEREQLMKTLVGRDLLRKENEAYISYLEKDILAINKMEIIYFLSTIEDPVHSSRITTLLAKRQNFLHKSIKFFFFK